MDGGERGEEAEAAGETRNLLFTFQCIDSHNFMPNALSRPPASLLFINKSQRESCRSSVKEEDVVFLFMGELMQWQSNSAQCPMVWFHLAFQGEASMPDDDVYHRRVLNCYSDEEDPTTL